MSARVRGSVRRAQLITSYGVGAVVALEDESFMVAGIDRWSVGDPDLHEPLLQRALGVRGFLQPPASKDGEDVPIVRFPTMSSCPGCDRLDSHARLSDRYENRCNRCGVPLVPSRFITACEMGHVADFPYFRWVHKGRPGGTGKHELTLHAAGRSASLRDIEIRCTCGAWRDMEGAFAPHALRGIVKCLGTRPWIGDGESGCDEPPRVLQRGASNVWFPVVRSAISIPPWSEGALAIFDGYWAVLRSVPEDALRATIESMGIAGGSGFTVDELTSAVLSRRTEESDPDRPAFSDIRRQEFEALARGRPEESSRQEFVCVDAPSQEPEVLEYLDRVMVVRRLREIRALTGFTRVRPPENAADLQGRTAPLAADAVGWLPAIEVRGEGVFIMLNIDRLRRWERHPAVIERADVIDRRYTERARQFGGTTDRTISPRLLLLHTLAHALIDQWALDSGYGAASLRERLYCGRDMAGILVYTATSDAAGSLGGLAAQVIPNKLHTSLTEAIRRARWCSSDPLCLEADAGGVDALNLGACHACCLLPEVSCEEMNILLDRAMLVGTAQDPSVGYFETS